MLGYVEEIIYGINVFRFNTLSGMPYHNKGIPYQLTIQEDISEKRYNIALIDLICLKKHTFDPDVRIVVSHILYKFLKNNRHYRLFFDIQIKKKKDLNRFYKFHRWSLQYPDIKFETLVTKAKGGLVYIEVYISLI